MISKIKKNYKVLIIGIGLGILISGIGVYATTKLSSSEVLYDNSKSGGASSNVQGTLEELYQKTKDYKPCSSAVWEANNKYFVEGYTYNETSCVTGDEKTCLRTDCYISSDKVCPPGTIIDYVVSGNSNKVRFHVMYDNGETMTMQSQKNIVYNVAWYKNANDNTKGPLTILPKLEEETKSWAHVEDQTYQMGTTNFNGVNAYTGCTDSLNLPCTTNTYTLGQRTAKARMITAQEAVKLGCSQSHKSCPNFINNYLSESTQYGGTVDDKHTENGETINQGYWTMSVYSAYPTLALRIRSMGYIDGNITTNGQYGARAVVVVSK